MVLERQEQWLVVPYSRHPPCVGSAGIHDYGAAKVKADSLDGTHCAANSFGGSAILHYSQKKTDGAISQLEPLPGN